MCNSVEFQKKHNEFSKRLLEKVKKKRIYHKMECGTEKRDFATDFGIWNGRNVRSFTIIVQLGDEIGTGEHIKSFSISTDRQSNRLC